jgi:hypothetical protein
MLGRTRCRLFKINRLERKFEFVSSQKVGYSCNKENGFLGKKIARFSGLFTSLDNIAVNRGLETGVKSSTRRVVTGIECGNFVDLHHNRKRTTIEFLRHQK